MTEFTRFNATDDVELQGWLNRTDGDTAVIHMHGMSGNGYENYFLDGLKEMYLSKNISTFFIDNRGRGVISGFRQNDTTKLAGSCYEIFEESSHDINGAIRYLESQGYTKFILQGHSLGCTKIVHFMTSTNRSNIQKIILLAPTDMVGWANVDIRNQQFLEKANTLVSTGRGEELIDPQCWIDQTPISAQTYAMCSPMSSADIYVDRPNGSLLSQINVPLLIVYGTEDIGIIEIDKTIETWVTRAQKATNNHALIEIISGASHGFRGYELDLVDKVQSFIG